MDIALPVSLYSTPDHLQLHSSVGIVTGLWDGRPRIRGSIPDGSNRVFSFQNVQLLNAYRR